MSWSLIEYIARGGEKKIKDICQVFFLDKLVDAITTKKGKILEQKGDHFEHE